MSTERIVYFKPDPNFKDTKSNLKAIREMTDEEAYQNALDDPDAQPMTQEELSRMRRIPNVKKIRETLGLTQKDFAKNYGLSVASVRDWEQLRSFPDRSTMSYLRVIEKIPEAVAEVIRGT